ncbi:VOC family protein [Chitinophaga alhagiae]|uniref:VOC family protein n=1 Tax=Chitinophaga alhagiae TaxID=2203219 RepID=UPI000E5BA69D|nr:VOC family protein [Chitinophaga alhagiae]
MATTKKPEGFQTVCPYFLVSDALQFMAFVKTVFDAEEVLVHKDDDGRVLHAEVRIDDSVIMFGNSTDAFPPETGAVFMFVNDTDAVYKKALAAGATSRQEPATKDYGRAAGIFDPWGNSWWITAV